MKLSVMITMGSFIILAVGCQESMETSQDQDRHFVNSRLIGYYNDTAIENAIVSQHTLYPYHFVTNGAELNELGRRDLAVLTKSFMQHAGNLNIRRHNTPADLYMARVNSTLDLLQEAGIQMDRMSISDDMPGGSGMASERVLIISRQQDKGTPERTSTTREPRISR